ncbi:F-box protein FBW2-like [Rosa rugosa]|uniref:F-box protein FBW2-like n=1 Tax=Rosa rugosa TaxID=74645 RepID=UPI002B411ACB|nr:F-box protein FBW2-like [Rosa rugosa]
MDTQRRWDELNPDCLLNVFRRLGMEELLYDVPFVCKSWHRASHNPSCWQSLIFPDIDHNAVDEDENIKYDASSADNESKPQSFGAFYDRFMHEYQIDSGRFSIGGIIKVVIKRSNGLPTVLKLPQNSTEEVLTSVSDVCPGLKFLSLSCDYKFSILSKYSLAVQELITNCTNLETLSLESSCHRYRNQRFNHVALLVQISIHCKNVVDLRVSNSQICKYGTFSIATLLPKIKYLSFRKCDIDQKDLISLLLRCKELVLLDMRDCVGFKVDDEISKLASHISTFVY